MKNMHPDLIAIVNIAARSGYMTGQELMELARFDELHILNAIEMKIAQSTTTDHQKDTLRNLIAQRIATLRPN